MLVPRDPFLSLILSTGIAWLIAVLLKRPVGDIYGIFVRRFAPQGLSLRLKIAIVGFFLLSALLIYFFVKDHDAFDKFSFLFLVCAIPLIFFSTLVLFGVKFVLKRIAPQSRAGWRIVFAMAGGSFLLAIVESLQLGYIDPFTPIAFVVSLPFTAICAIVFDIFGTICIKWFQARKAEQGDT